MANELNRLEQSANVGRFPVLFAIMVWHGRRDRLAKASAANLTAEATRASASQASRPEGGQPACARTRIAARTAVPIPINPNYRKPFQLGSCAGFWEDGRLLLFFPS
jgi:hypothetical protein